MWKIINVLPVANSVLSGGLASVIAWGLSLGLTRFGVTIETEELVPLIIIIGSLATHFTPDSLEDKARALNADVKKLAAVIPQIQASFPTGKNAANKTGKTI